MGYIKVCDLCGKPMREAGKTYRIKERWTSWYESGWTTIEAHDECVKRLLNALAENVGKYESQFGRIMLEGAANGNTFNLADMMQGGGAKS
jgi:hypothetical protein